MWSQFLIEISVSSHEKKNKPFQLKLEGGEIGAIKILGRVY